MSFLKKIKTNWEKLWMPQVQSGKTELELDRDKQYETKWVWYHTILAVELALTNILLLWIAIKI